MPGDGDTGKGAERVQIVRYGHPVDGVGDHIVERDGKTHGGIAHHINHIEVVTCTVAFVLGDAVRLADGDGLVVVAVENVGE